MASFKGHNLVLIKSSIHFWSFAETNNLFSELKYSVLTASAKGEEIEERIASSDYYRSGWCPGSKVSPKKISLGKLKKGRHELSIFIPNAQVTTETEFNFWNIAAYIAY